LTPLPLAPHNHFLLFKANARSKEKKGDAMRFTRAFAGLAPLLVLVVLCQQFFTQTSTPKKGAPAAEKKGAPAAQKKGAPAQSSAVARGKYLVTIMGCHDCHSPKIKGEPDQKRILSGQPATEKLAGVPQGLIAPDKWGAVTNNHLTAWVGAWGVSFAANLTPDRETGLGNWSPNQFIAALRTGKTHGDPTQRNILPPMPWVMYKDMEDADLRAIFAYLQSIPAIKNLVPAPLPPNMIPK
jgi:hypothetical protein